MKQVNWESVLGQIEDDLLLEAISNDKPTIYIRSIPRKVLFLAAAIALIFMLGLTAYAANLFGVRDMLMERSGKSYITITGYQSSNEYQALMEWEERRPKRTQHRDSRLEDPRYDQYGAYSYTARKIMDEIWEKYDLKPYDQWTAVYDRDPQSLYEAVGVVGFLPESCATFRGTTDPNSPGCSVRNGITVFSFSDSTLLPDGTKVHYEFNSSAKGYMPIFMGAFVDPDTAPEWTYKAKDGTEVLLCTATYNSLILLDLPNSFLSIIAVVDTEDSDTHTPLSESQLEDFADLFDYTIICKIGNP